MYLAVLNSYNSKTGLECEANLVRLSLMLSDRVLSAGRCSHALYLKRYMDGLKGEERYELLRQKAAIIFKDNPDIAEGFNSAVESYKTLSNQTGKNKADLIVLMTAKKFIDHVRNVVLNYMEYNAGKKVMEDLLPFSPGRENVVSVRVLADTDPLFTIETVSDSILYADVFMIFDRAVFNSAESVRFDSPGNEIEKLFKNPDEPAFLFGEMFRFNLVQNLDPRYFKLIRNNFLCETEQFRNSLLNAKNLFYDRHFTIETVAPAEEQFNNIKRYAEKFEETEKEYPLLNNLLSAGRPVKKMKINFAVTSCKNIITMLRQMDIINDREMLYILENISKELEPSVCVPFLIAEEEP